MATTSLTIANVGTILVSNSIVTSVTLVAPPKLSAGYYFTLVDQDNNGNYLDDVFCMQTGNMPFPTGTVFPLYGHPFTNLVLTSISPDATFSVTTA